MRSAIASHNVLVSLKLAGVQNNTAPPTRPLQDKLLIIHLGKIETDVQPLQWFLSMVGVTSEKQS